MAYIIKDIFSHVHKELVGIWRDAAVDLKRQAERVQKVFN